MPVANLTDAATTSMMNMVKKTVLGTLQSSISTFCDQVLAAFPDPMPGNRPVLNWVAVLDGYKSQMGGAADDYVELRISADYMYRLCYMAAQSQTQSMISAAQAAAILASYNLNFP